MCTTLHHLYLLDMCMLFGYQGKVAGPLLESCKVCCGNRAAMLVASSMQSCWANGMWHLLGTMQSCWESGWANGMWHLLGTMQSCWERQLVVEPDVTNLGPDATNLTLECVLCACFSGPLHVFPDRSVYN